MSKPHELTGIALALAIILVAPPSVWLVLLAAALAGVLLQRRRIERTAPPALIGLTIASSAVVVAALISFLATPVTAYGLLLVLRLSMLPLAAGAFWLVGRRDAVVVALWVGATVGAIVAGGVAVVEVLATRTRASGWVGNAIVFGDIALLMGAVSLSAQASVRGRTSRSWPRTRPTILAHLTFGSAGSSSPRAVERASRVAGACGLLASVLSGSRGGWLALPVVATLLVIHHRRAITARRAAGAIGAFVLVLLVALAVSRGMPAQRAGVVVGEVTSYVGASPSAESAGSSVGARIEAWRSALDAFRQRPLLGIGWGNLRPHFAADVERGARHAQIARFDHAHNQFLSGLANGGVAGLATTVAVFAVPGWFSWIAWRSSDPRQRALGLTGLVAVTSFVVYAATESILEHLVPVTFYAITVSALASQQVAGHASSLRRHGAQNATPVRCEERRVPSRPHPGSRTTSPATVASLDGSHGDAISLLRHNPR